MKQQISQKACRCLDEDLASVNSTARFSYLAACVRQNLDSSHLDHGIVELAVEGESISNGLDYISGCTVQSQALINLENASVHEDLPVVTVVYSVGAQNVLIKIYSVIRVRVQRAPELQCLDKKRVHRRIRAPSSVEVVKPVGEKRAVCDSDCVTSCNKVLGTSL